MTVASNRRAAGPRRRRLSVGEWRIELTARASVPRVGTDAALARAIGAALEAAGAPRPAAVELILTGDAEIAELNLVHFGEAGPTDVLSFPLLPPEAFPPHEADPDRGPAAPPPFPLPPGVPVELGSIVVSVERAIDQARSGRGGQTGDVRWSPADELRLLVVHGALHLCGWDHADPAEEAAMRALERRILAETETGRRARRVGRAERGESGSRGQGS
ncbi:MAG TPA: rRNA maturation RNase YbeY [Candidatus Limnocylindrales bacterium]|nr:rRNA maturation RNase YbeY [Candidatus Limnocylindrales bacterium]